MKDLIIIAAIGKNNELGRNNNLIWKAKEDMKFFKETTTNHCIVMGKNTYLSLPHLLPNRKHIVLTRTNYSFPNEVVRCGNIEDFFEYALDVNDDIYVIGGAQIYNQFIDYANKMYLTEFDATCSMADCYFPNIDNNVWNSEVIGEFKDNEPKYLRKVYTRRNS